MGHTVAALLGQAQLGSGSSCRPTDDPPPPPPRPPSLLHLRPPRRDRDLSVTSRLAGHAAPDHGPLRPAAGRDRTLDSPPQSWCAPSCGVDACAGCSPHDPSPRRVSPGGWPCGERSAGSSTVGTVGSVGSAAIVGHAAGTPTPRVGGLLSPQQYFCRGSASRWYQSSRVLYHPGRR
jgi:hypothetical protein